MYYVGIDGHMLGDHSGGNESYYRNILLNFQQSKDIKYILFLKKDVDSREFENNFQIVRFKTKNALLRNFVELPYLCRKYRLDLLHTQYFIPLFLSCPIVCTIHDICFEHFNDIFTKKEQIQYKLLIPYSAKKSKVILTVSNYAKRDIVDTYRINDKKVVVTYNAAAKEYVKIKKTVREREIMCDQFGIGDFEYILTVGNIQPRKNLKRLIRAFALLQKEHDRKIKLVIVGKKAWMYEDTFNEAKEYTDYIVFTDYVEREDLVRLYNYAKCFVYPSLYEGFGIPPIEALACGTPVAVSNTSSLPEVVGGVGYYFNPYDIQDIKSSLIKLLNDIDNDCVDYSNITNQGNKYSWNSTAEIVTNTYKELLLES